MPARLLADVEIMVGFLATSIATYRPLYQSVFGDVPVSKGGYSAKSKPDPSHKYFNQRRHSVKVSAVKPDNHKSTRGITVTNQFEFSSYDYSCER